MALRLYRYIFSEPAGNMLSGPWPTENALHELRIKLAARELLCLRAHGMCAVISDEEQAPDSARATAILWESGLLPAGEREGIIVADRAAADGFFRLACDVESRPFETRLRADFRLAYAQAVEAACIGPNLSYLFKRAEALHREIAERSDYYRYAVHTDTVVRELAGKILGDPTDIQVALSGDISTCCSLLAELYAAGFRRFGLYGNAESACNAEEHYSAVPYPGNALAKAIEHIGLLICGPGGAQYLPDKRSFARSVYARGFSPMMLVDLAHDGVASARCDCEGVFVYNRSDLANVIRHNLHERRDAALIVEQFIGRATSDFLRWNNDEQRFEFSGMISRNPQMQRVFELIERVAQSDSTILIEGESGTGKELMAQAVHRYSTRHNRPFITVNCGAIPEALLESELFGHVRGAFTGAIAEKPGLLAEAAGGSVLLDEIGELPQSLQVKLLRFLQDGEIRPLGSKRSLQVDVRVIAATNRHLAALVDSGEFRSDLFYRLNVIALTAPPLRERTEDIPLLVQHFIRRNARKMNKSLGPCPPDVLETLQKYPWPGNIRELENAIERAVALTVGDAIALHDLPEYIRRPAHKHPEANTNGPLSLREVERRHILQTLAACNGNHENASRILGIGRTTLWRKLREYGVHGEN